MTWQASLIAALSVRMEFADLWDAADARQRQSIIETLIAAQTCCVIIHRRGRVRYVNRRLEYICGIALSEIHGGLLTCLMADPASRRQSIECIGSDEGHDYIVIMNCLTGKLTMSVQSHPFTWYGERCRVALLTPILTREAEREWMDGGEPVQVIGEAV